MSPLPHQLVTLVLAAVAMVWLPRGRWTHASPRTALVLWQLVVVSAVLSLVGALLSAGLAPRGVVSGLVRFAVDDDWRDNLATGRLVAILAGLSVAGLLAAEQIHGLTRTARARARHRRLLHLVADSDGDALVVGHPIPVAYCLPGRHPKIVFSAGARDLLTPAQLRAVLAHERAHVHERHHLLLEPFESLRLLLPTRALQAIQLLVEMCADDKAARRHGNETLAGALERFHAVGSGGTPAGAFAAATVSIEARIQRLRHPPRSTVALRIFVIASAAVGGAFVAALWT